MIRKIAFSLLLFFSIIEIQAQNQFEKPQQIYDWMVAGQGDSLFVHSNATMQSHISAEMLGKLFQQLESQLGKVQSTENWISNNLDNNIVYSKNVTFEKNKLAFTVVIDSDMKISGIRMTPPVHPPSELVENDVFREENIQVVTDNFKLPGILTLPLQVKNPPVAILVQGSGPVDKDETIGPNKPFRELAWGLAERGIAVIRYDKRTFVYGGDFAVNGKVDIDEETVNDALSAIKLAAAHKNLADSKIYILGNSQGAWFAPRIAEREPNLAGIIMVAAPARRFEDVLTEQFDYLINFPNTGLTEKSIAEYKTRVANMKKLGTPEYDESIPLPLDVPKSYWEYINNYNQTETARKLTLPIFVIQGESDYQITMEDFNLWKKALEHKSNVSFKSYPGLNHILHKSSGQKATPMEYDTKGEIPGYVMDDIAAWILNNK